MITIADITELCELKSQLYTFIAENRDKMVSRDWSEGLEHYVDLNGDAWSYVRSQTGWEFTCRSSAQSIALRQDARDTQSFNAHDLCLYLRSHRAEYENLNELAVENWLTRALLAGRLEADKELNGYFRLITVQS